MKVFIKKETGLIGLSEDFVSLKELTTDGYFVYSVKYKIDPARAMQLKAHKVNIHVSKEAPNKKKSNSFSSFDAPNMLRNVLFKAAEEKNLARSSKSNIVFTLISDITKRIPNDQISSISKSNLGLSKVRTVKELKLASVAELNQQNIAMPVLQTNLYKKNENTQSNLSSIDIRELSYDLIYNKGIDPSSIASKSNTIVSSEKVYAGLTTHVSKYKVSAITGKNTAGIASDTVKIPEKNKGLLESILNKSIPVIATQLHLSPNDLMSVVLDTPVTFIEIEEELRIPVGSITDDEFYLIFELNNSAGNTVESISNSVSHSNFVTTLKIPKLAPIVKILPSGRVGKTVLLIKQKDPYAIGVDIYRKTMDKHGPQIDAQYTFVGKLDLKAGEDFKRVEDAHSNFNPTIYRVVPFNESGILSSEFTSVISKSANPPLGIKTNKEKKINFVSMAYSFEEHGIDIEIKDIPPGPIAINLEKKNLSLYEKDTTAVADVLLLNGRGSAPIVFSDNDVKKDQIYEYSCKFIYKDGHEDYASNKLTIEYLPITNNVVDTNLGNPIVIQNGSELDVTFDITSNLIESTVDLIKRALNQQGLFGVFQEDIINNKEKLQNLLGYKVVRINLTTGEIEDFGIIIDTVFSDRKFGKVKGVKPLQGGHDYRYTVSTYFRSPETLIQTFEREVETSTNESYTLQPAKWLHPVTLFKGNIVSANSLKANHSKTDFSHGAIGGITTVNVSLSKVLPSLYDAKATKIIESQVLVQWKIQGEVNKIDHFLVILEMLGMRTIVGKCHNISNSNNFQFIDVLDNNEHGALIYNIVPVFYDYNRGTEIKTNQVIV